jgi:tetratricopeptide (TPR) repeat protein
VRDNLEQLKVAGRADPGSNVFQLLRSWLRDEKRGKWLIILDNLDDARFLLESPASTGQATGASQAIQHGERYLDYLPAANHGSTLLTSRSERAATQIVDRRRIVAVEPMSERLAVELVRKKLGDKWSEEDVVQLVEALDRMPLAISQAAAYIEQRKPRCSVRQYVEKLDRSNRSKRSLLNRDEGDLRRDREASNSIMLTWRISFEHVREVRPSAADLLSLMSFCDRQAIPGILLRERVIEETGAVKDTNDGESREGAGVSGEDGSDDIDDFSSSGSSDEDEEFEEDLAMLRGYSFISYTADPATFEMHRLVQLATQKWLKFHERLERWGSQFVSNLDDAFPSGEYEEWAVCQPLLPHATMALEMESLSIEAKLRQANLLLKSGWYALQQGSFDTAEEMQSLAMRVRKKVLKGGHPDTLTSMGNLAGTYSRQGRWDEAEKLQVEVMQTRKEVLPEGHPSTLTSMANLAMTYSSQGRWDEAEKLEVEVMQTSKEVLPEGHPDTLTSMSNLAMTYSSQGRWDEAEKLQVEVMEKRKEVLPEGHPDTLTSMSNLAGTYSDQGRWDEAEKLEVEVMQTSKEVLPEGHPDTLTSMANLAVTLRSLGRQQSSLDLMKQCVASSSDVLGPRHPDTLNRCRWIAMWAAEDERGEE